MSRRKSPVNDIRFDSATDLRLPYDERHYPSINDNAHARKGRQTPTIQPRVPKSSPTTQTGKYIPPHRRISPPVSDQFDAYTSYTTAITTPCPYLSNSMNPNSPTSSTSSASYASILARSSSATPSTSTVSTASLVAESKPVYCNQCNAKFTGIHGRGNLARHVRHKHTGLAAVLFKCRADGCTSIFARQDARLKHERQQHPELVPELVKKEPSCSPAPHMAKQTEKLSAEPPPIPYTLSIDDVPQSARTFLCRVRARLDNTNYARFRDMFMTLLERLVLYQRDTNSDAYGAYAKVLDNMNVIVDAIDAGSIDIVDQAHQDIGGAESYARSSRPAQATRSSKNRTSSIDLWPKDKPRPDSNTMSTGRKSSSHGKQNNVKVTKRDRGKGPRNRAVDCPDHKHYIMFPDSRTSPCAGCRVFDMSQVRRHLKLTAHNGRLGAQQCPFCKQEFDSQETFNAHDAAKNCQNQAQLRGPIEKPWALLYLARYPEADRIPSPFCDTKEWLPHSILEECRIWLQNNAPRSFLGEPTYTTGGPYNNQLLSNPVVLNEWFRNALGWTVSMGNGLASRFPDATNALTGFNMDPESSERGPLHHDTRYHISEIYFNNEQYFGTPAEAPLYVQQEQLRPLADDAAAAARPMENNIQYPSLEHDLNGSWESTTGESTASTIKPPESIYGASQTVTQYWPRRDQAIQNEGSQTPHIAYHHAPSISTPSYTPDRYHGSSQYNISPQTGPSSTYEPVDDMHFSPLASPYYYPRTLQSFNFTDCPVSSILQSDHLALPDPLPQPEYLQPMGTSMGEQVDPTLEQQQFSYFNQYGDVTGIGQWNAH